MISVSHNKKVRQHDSITSANAVRSSTAKFSRPRPKTFQMGDGFGPSAPIPGAMDWCEGWSALRAPLRCLGLAQAEV